MTVYLTQAHPDSNAKIHLDIDCGYIQGKRFIPVEVACIESVAALDICELCSKPEELAAKRTAWRRRRG